MYRSESPLLRRARQALAVAAFGLLLGVVAGPQASLAATIQPPQQSSHVVHPDDGSGDNPVVP